MTPGSRDDTVWYLAYGSNLSASRLQRYLDRGPSPRVPLDARPSTFRHRLFFAHESTVWTGGTAFVDPVPGQHETFVLAWRLRRDQFLSVLAQENRRAEVDVDDTVFELAPGETLQADDRRYGLVVGCESPDHRPALTFTTPERPLPAPNRASRPYVDTIVAGLVEGHGLCEADARTYVSRHGG